MEIIKAIRQKLAALKGRREEITEVRRQLEVKEAKASINSQVLDTLQEQFKEYQQDLKAAREEANDYKAQVFELLRENGNLKAFNLSASEREKKQGEKIKSYANTVARYRDYMRSLGIPIHPFGRDKKKKEVNPKTKDND